MSSDGTSGGANLWDRLAHDAGSYRSSLHSWVGDRYESSTWSEVVRNAESMTAGLRRAGVRPGTRVATVLTNNPYAVRGLLGTWLAGGAVASLPVPARGMNPNEYANQLIAICDSLEPAVFLIEERMLGLISEDIRQRVPVRSWESFAGSGRVDPAPPGDDELVFIQYSSGSTSTPKGCMLSPRAIASQLEIVSTMLKARPGRDVCVTWLPLSHDMGLFGCLLTCWWNNFTDYMSTPERFMFSPGTWFSDMARFGGTVTAGSNTGLYLAARSAAKSGSIEPTGLAQTRVVIIGSERVEWETLRHAVDSLGPYGFREEALMPAYGLAEATLAVTATGVLQLPQRIAVDTLALADGELREVSPDDPGATSMVSAGPPCGGVELPGAGPDSLTEISVRSPALAMGYWGDEQRTQAHFHDGTLLTSDLGFVRDGHLYPVGRVDDVISIAGRKVYAREIENAVEAIAGFRRGCSTLVCRNGASFRLTLFAEVQPRLVDYRALAEQAADVAMAKAAVALDECVFLGRNTLPKTPSGKIQRHRCRQLFDAGRFEPLATVQLESV
jgi:fatty-acyl-CoA synthase